MKHYLIFAGTVEGRLLAEFCSKYGIPATVSVATEYGETLVDHLPGIRVSAGRLDTQQMELLIRQEGFDAVIDATHPYADVATQNIRAACQAAKVEYRRLLRAETDLKDIPNLKLFDDVETAADWLETQEGRIFLTTGLKELPVFAEHISDTERIYARVLLQEAVFEILEKYNFTRKQILCMQGPFSKEMNVATMNQIRADFLVTKEAGKAGGFMEKIEAAIACKATCVVIRRPVKEEGESLETIMDWMENQCGIQKEEESEEPLVSGESIEEERRVTLLGIGMGSMETMTVGGVEACKSADLIIGANRMLKTLEGFAKPTVSMYLSDEIVKYIAEHKEYKDIVVALSGDVGFYSGATKLQQKLQMSEEKLEVRMICGISSVVYLASKLGMTWEDMALVSIHGREQNLISAVRRNKKVFSLAASGDSIRNLASQLCEHGLGHIPMHVGVDLSYDTEQIISDIPAEFRSFETSGICAVVLENPEADQAVITHGFSDEAFLRAKVPMTKEEIRSISLSKMQLTRNAVVYDIGAGTGSISIECANVADRGMVYAIERKEDAIALIEENKKHFGVTNLTVVPGLAPEAMEHLPAPTHAFIGGSGGNMQSIVELLLKKNPAIRIVVNCIALDTLAEVMQLIQVLEPAELDICSVNVAKSKTLAGYHMMMGQNPVYVITLDYR